MLMYVNQYDRTGECGIRGQAVEDMFESWLIANGKNYRKASLEEQFAHIDFVIWSEPQQKEITVDLKAPKKVSRGNSWTQDEFIWVEFKNVQGLNGWLYGKNDYLVFYKKDEDLFYCVKTSDLAKLCEIICCKGRTENSKDALYKRYTRKGRYDELSLIKFEDLKKIEHYSFR